MLYIICVKYLLCVKVWSMKNREWFLFFEVYVLLGSVEGK